MKKIGTTVKMLVPTEGNPRNGECSFLRLKNGAILYAYSKYVGTSAEDHAKANIVALTSYDEGETWVEERTLLVSGDDSLNYMCPCLLRMQNGDLGLIYLKKIPSNRPKNAPLISEDGAWPDCFSDVLLVRSQDEGETWSEPVLCSTPGHYYVIENDHVIRLKSGRILIPVNLHDRGEYGVMGIFASDDDGATWYSLAENIHTPFPQISRTGLQETVLYEHTDGRLHAYARTDLGCQLECTSDDQGKTWTAPVPNLFFTSPCSPLMLRDIGIGTAAVFNPIPNYTARDKMGEPTRRTWGRTPLVCAISKDDGKTYPSVYYLEDDLTNGYCYPAIFAGDGYFLVSYYHSNDMDMPLRASKILKIRWDELN